MVNAKPVDIVGLITSKMRCLRHFHFVGIGGSGMGGIATILAQEGYIVSGSELSPNAITQYLKTLGVIIFAHHCPENIKNAHVLVISSAISQDNPEVVAAHKANIPVILRAEMLSELMRSRYGITVSGTHGKTTTTAMIACIYQEGGLDPTFINGGMIKGIRANARLGKSCYLVVEADESDASFLYLQPILAVITNIEADHMDTYQGNFNTLKQTFIKFLHNLPFYGRAILCVDDEAIRSIIPQIKRKIITYGCRKNADVQIQNYQHHKGKGCFHLIRQNKPLIKVTLNTPGLHHALNAAAAIAVATEDGIADADIICALQNFQGVSRRFDILGEYPLARVNGSKGTAILIDDYGHHPTEIDVTIKTIRARWPDRNLIMIFQPHRYTRTRDLHSDFINTLSQVDELIMLEVYSAGELPISGADSNSLCRAIQDRQKINPILISNHDRIIDNLLPRLTGNNLILVQGAGNIETVACDIAKALL
ncbi:UDP-N-acetylmuramate--L-alanine ligase [Candidatus Erwinia haradaeae]|uniref:UDP-N-acetylmuramate--L-alanine ligase n=1 Tax=Candidatus Erwinia haradaeae TaxID=1922217 RepID=A0A451DJZ6_9GAMM|nr:UDP-N-acetylmuramate--L-alanine ligase [Candidatus Erwinia haradaeae]VFP87012.1 UDP-N-acetylmuramate--L-alanine ligase [Candidatus Erwinia haradaeae]